MADIKDLPLDFESAGEAELAHRLNKHARFASNGLMTSHEFTSNTIHILADSHAFYPTAVPAIWDFITDEIKFVFAAKLEEILQPNYLYNTVFAGGRVRTNEENLKRWGTQTEMLRKWAKAFLEYSESLKSL